MARYNKVYLGPADENVVQTIEGTMASDQAPGAIVIRSGSNLAPHGTAGEGGEVFVLDHDYLGGRNIDQLVESGNTGMAIRPQDSQELAALVATGNDVTAGDPLTSSGSGTLAIAAAGEVVLFYAQESFNNDTGSDALIRVRPGAGTVPAA